MAADDSITIRSFTLTLDDGTVIDGDIQPVVVSPTQTPVRLEVTYLQLLEHRRGHGPLRLVDGGADDGDAG